jgi:hypothetical protein
MKSRIWIIACALMTAGIFGSGCKKSIDDQTAVTDPSLNKNLMELISAKADLSTFAGYLKQTGYDAVIASSRTYTVFAPGNAELATLDAAIKNDPVKLKLFIGNHIATQLYSTKDVTATTRIQMMSGKYNNMKGTAIGTAVITTADTYASNGLLQVVSKMLPALENCWDFVNNNSQAPAKQKAFMLSLFRNVFDPTNGVVIGVNPVTGAPIYQAGTDSVYTNLFWNKVYDLRDEKKQFTLFMMEDVAWDADQVRFAPYYVTNTTDSNKLVTGWNVLRDFAVDTLYEPGTIPDTVTSKFGTRVPIERSAIVNTIRTSNGIVYIMSRINVQPASKLKTILIQGENYSGTSHDRRSNTYFRERFNPVTGLDFRDVEVLNHGVALFNIRYQVEEVPSIKYKAYWVAVNDFQTATYSQRLAPGIATATTFPYTVVALNNFNEVYLGEFTMAQYQPVYNMYLVAANSTTQAVNPLVLDYIKLVPSL